MFIVETKDIPLRTLLYVLLILIIFIVAVCVLTVIGKKIFALAPAAVNFLMVIYDSFFSTSLHGESDFASVDVSLKIGGYLIIIAGIIILAISIFQFLKEKNIIWILWLTNYRDIGNNVNWYIY